MDTELIKILKDIKNYQLASFQLQKLQHMELIKELRGLKSQA